MQVTETLSQGLKREYDIFLPASDLAEKLNGQLAELKSKAQINGFRPGKVPVEHLRKIYGKSVMADVVQEAITKANKQIVDDNHLRLAREPKVELPTDQAAIDAALEARGDLNFKVALEVLPTFEIGDFSEIELERLTTDVEDADVANAIERLADGRRTYAEKPEGAKAEAHDRVTVDFDGKIDGDPFEGGEGRDIEVLIGSNTFIPGFEDQLLGVARRREARRPRDVPRGLRRARRSRARRASSTSRSRRSPRPSPSPSTTNSPRASASKSLDKLKEMFRDRVTAEYARASRDKVKRQLLDKLDALYSFELPEGLVNQEFDGIWTQVMQEQEAAGRSFADENTTEEAARADYRRIAERRVRLGLLLAEVGTKAEVKIADEEMTQALIARGAPVPGAGKAGLGFLPQQSAGARRTARPDLRGEGRGLHPWPRQGRRPQGRQGRADETARRRIAAVGSTRRGRGRRRGRGGREAGGLTSGRRAQGLAARRRPAPLSERRRMPILGRAPAEQLLG